MNLDKYGLPVQANGDANDQLQRVGMIDAAEFIRSDMALTDVHTEWALYQGLQPKQDGVYTRSVGSNPNNVSADQLIAALAAWVVRGETKQVGRMAWACLKRLGFAQNTRDLDGTKKWLPDFMLLRSLPLFARAHKLAHPLCLLIDGLLVLSALSAASPFVFRDNKILPTRRSPDDVDHNNTILTSAVCSKRMPTPLSWLARKLFTKLLPWNYGCIRELGNANARRGSSSALDLRISHYYHPVYGSLRWYHRKEAGGNPEIAELWAPICKELFE